MSKHVENENTQNSSIPEEFDRDEEVTAQSPPAEGHSQNSDEGKEESVTREEVRGNDSDEVREADTAREEQALGGDPTPEVERGGTGKQDEENNAAAPDICLCAIVCCRFDNFWGGIVWASTRRGELRANWL